MTATRQRILIAEDEPAIADNLVYVLESEGFAPQWVITGQAVLDAVAAAAPDLIVLDVGLPDMNGFDVCREVRRHSLLPIIFLTARDSEIDRVVGLEIGADDYVVKPFSPRELTARVRARLRTHGLASEATQCSAAEAGFVVDTARRTVRKGSNSLHLTCYEFRLFATLHGQPLRVFSREQLLAQAWDDPVGVFDRTVDTHIKTLRQKLRAANNGHDPIRTHRGVGYAYDPSA